MLSVDGEKFLWVRIAHKAIRAAEVASSLIASWNCLEVIVIVAKEVAVLLRLCFAKGIVASKLAVRLFFNNGDTVCGVISFRRNNFDVGL